MIDGIAKIYGFGGHQIPTLAAVKSFKKTLSDRVEMKQKKLPPPSHGRRYAHDLKKYMRFVDDISGEYASTFKSVADNISRLGGNNWLDKPPILALWMELAEALELLRHNPLKGAAAIYVDSKGELMTMGTASYARGLRLPSHLLKPNRRTRFTVCGERDAVRCFFGEKIPPNDYLTVEERTLPAKDRKIRRLQIMESTLFRKISDEEKFRDSILFTTAMPCMSCANLIMAGKVARVYYKDSKQPMATERQFSMEKAAHALRHHGIPVIRL